MNKNGWCKNGIVRLLLTEKMCELTVNFYSDDLCRSIPNGGQISCGFTYSTNLYIVY